MWSSHKSMCYRKASGLRALSPVWWRLSEYCCWDRSGSSRAIPHSAVHRKQRWRCCKNAMNGFYQCFYRNAWLISNETDCISSGRSTDAWEKKMQCCNLFLEYIEYIYVFFFAFAFAPPEGDTVISFALNTFELALENEVAPPNNLFPVK